MKLATKVTLLSVAIVGVCTAASAREIGNPWPSILPVAKTFHFPDAKSASVELTVAGRDKRPLYLLECHVGGYYNAENPSFEYTGAFDCHMRN